MLTTQRKPSPKSVYLYPERNLKYLQYLTTKVYYPSLLQALIRFLKLVKMWLMVWDAFLVPNYNSTLPSKERTLTLIVSFDVSALFTNIPVSGALEVMNGKLASHLHKKNHKPSLNTPTTFQKIKFLELVLITYVLNTSFTNNFREQPQVHHSPQA